MTSINFQHHSVNNLYNKLHSYEVSQFETFDQIKNALYPYVQNVINDNKAYEEAIKFYEFKPLKTHIKDRIKDFVNLDLISSMIVSIWFYVYH